MTTHQAVEDTVERPGFRRSGWHVRRRAKRRRLGVPGAAACAPRRRDPDREFMPTPVWREVQPLSARSRASGVTSAGLVSTA